MSFCSKVFAFLVTGLILIATEAPAAYANQSSSPTPSGWQPVKIDNAVYARCTARVLAELGPPAKQAANFDNLQIAFAYRCALNGGRGW